MRFINVGVFKTGLSSFREFFQQCEIQAIDWEAIDKAEHAFETHQDVLETMESFKCLADIPACYESFHESLVRRFPNAKFFMSVRDPQRWLTSMKKHYFSRLMKGSNNITSQTLAWCGIQVPIDELQYSESDDTFMDAYTSRNARIIDNFKKAGIPLLVYDLDDDAKVDLIRKHAGILLPDEFPRSNESGDEHLMNEYLVSQGLGSLEELEEDLNRRRLSSSYVETV
jgi:hypothetical protein